jgi:hypothetical protein
VVEVLGDPEQRVEIAQAALAFLDVGLDQIARVAGLAVALVALGELGEMNSGPVPSTTSFSKRSPRSSKSARSPQMKRASRMAVRMVMSERESLMHSSTLRVAWPTFRPMSQRI